MSSLPQGITASALWYQNAGAKTVIPNEIEEQPWTPHLREAIRLMLDSGMAGMEQRREFSRDLAAFGVIAAGSRKRGADYLGVAYDWLRDYWDEWRVRQRELRRKRIVGRV